METFKSVKHGTLTTEGLIPHIRHALGFEMPVEVIVPKNPDGLPRPRRNDAGQLLFALPGYDKN